MAWGGFGGGFGGGPAQRPGQAAPGLPFAGVPPEMLPLVEKMLANEPEHDDPNVGFSHRSPRDQKDFSLRKLLRPHWFAIAIGIAMVGVETATMQAGPLLTQRALDDGILAG